MKHKIAVLSNINMNFVLRILKKNFEVYDTEGYGNELGLLMDKTSSYHAFGADSTFLVMDLLEVLGHNFRVSDAKEVIDTWFSMFEAGMCSTSQYYISDAYLWGTEVEVFFYKELKLQLERLWNERLEALCDKCKNVHLFPYHDMIRKLGEENTFSLKMWYMGKILHTNEAQKRIAENIIHCMDLAIRVPKKVLLLDLDNTLWGGIAGEHEHTPIVLSDDHAGLAYKNLQRVIAMMQESGVVLGIVSKNNEEDALELLRNHSHMVLREDAFAIKKINWEPKNKNIQEIAQELNLGLDSFVFFDDNPTERELIRQTLPQVVVPDFPDRPEELAGAMADIYHAYFEKAFVTAEDLEKTRQYAENAKRSQAMEQAVSFEDYLKQLKLVITKVDASEHIERLVQLVNKTNQFNLTTKRYEMSEMQKIVTDTNKRVYLYKIEDCFGDYGIVGAVIVDVTEQPVVEEFVLSCRVMGKNVEYAIISQIEKELAKEGFETLQGIYIPTAKNKPVEQLYERLGYEQEVEGQENKRTYRIALNNLPERDLYALVQ